MCLRRWLPSFCSGRPPPIAPSRPARNAVSVAAATTTTAMSSKLQGHDRARLGGVTLIPLSARYSHTQGRPLQSPSTAATGATRAEQATSHHQHHQVPRGRYITEVEMLRTFSAPESLSDRSEASDGESGGMPAADGSESHNGNVSGGDEREDERAAYPIGVTSSGEVHYVQTDRDTPDIAAERVSNLSNNTGHFTVSWFDYDIHPSKQFTYWAFRRLRELPPEWRGYYRQLLMQEVRGSMYITSTWDMFMSVVDGYRKGRWVLQKYGVPVDASLIPHPYDNFWENTTHEERAWAHRRAYHLKELQAFYREDDVPQGNVRVDIKNGTLGKLHGNAREVRGHTQHSQDMPPPGERDMKPASEQEQEYNQMLLSSVEEDKLWNPLLKARVQQQKTKRERELYAFEDDDEFE